MDERVQNIIDENNKRLALINAKYDPYTGEGSTCCKRQPLVVGDTTLYLPVQMFDCEDKGDRRFMSLLCDLHSFKEVAKALSYGGTYISEQQAKLFFVRIRIKYDFEFWAASFIKIKPKAGTKASLDSKGDDVPFILNRGQRKYLTIILKLWFEGKPIRIVLLKARQWGGSTLTQIFFMWIQFIHFKKWNSVVCAHVKTASGKIEGMYRNAINKYPYILDTDATGPFKMDPYMNLEGTRQVSFRGCTISVGSAERPDGLRCEDVSLAHFSEVAFFKKTKNGSNAEAFVRNVSSGVAPVFGTMVVFESTADGVGDFFHSEWVEATKALRSARHDSLKPAYVPVFVAWYDIENYAVEIDNYEKFISTMTDDERKLFSYGATLEQINWYRYKAVDVKNIENLHSEFPSNDVEAFLSSGRPYFPIADCKKLENTCYAAPYVGELVSDDVYGAKALDNIHFVEKPNGPLKIWAQPDRSVKIENRYVVVVDVNKGISSGADNGIICVFDRYWMAVDPEHGVPEVVAEWCGKDIMSYFAWTAAKIARFYDNAYLVIEANTPETTSTAGFELDTILGEIAEYYDNLYYRLSSAEDINGQRPKKIGFHTNKKTKKMFCSHHQVVLHRSMYIERCYEAVMEHETFEYKDNGELGAAIKSHDDRLITRALGCYIIYKEMERAEIIDESQAMRYYMSHKIVNESTII